MRITYRELIENLKSLPDARLDDTVTVYVSGVGEFYPLVQDYPFVVVDGKSAPGDPEFALDEGHPYLVI
jgi:hypothetical protein